MLRYHVKSKYLSNLFLQATVQAVQPACLYHTLENFSSCSQEIHFLATIRMLLRFQWLVLWLALLVTKVASSLAAPYEKIWFYYAYNLSWKLNGEDQTAILPFLPKGRSNGKNNGNKGTTNLSGQLDFPEFIDRLTFSWPGTCKVQLDTADLDSTAQQLKKSHLGGTIRVGIATNTGSGTSTPEVSYNTLIERLTNVVSEARKKFPDSSDVSDAVAQMDKLLTTITRLRRTEFSSIDYIGRQMAELFNLPVDDDKNPTTIVTMEVADPEADIASGKTVEVVDIQATFADPQNKALIMKKFGQKKGSVKNFKNWVNNYGIKPPPGSTALGYDKVATDHKDVLDLWTSAKNQLGRPVC
jgi:hypothetical protein